MDIRSIATFALAVLFAGSASGLGARQQVPGGASPVKPTTSFDVVEKTIPDLQTAMTSGSVTSRQLVAAYLARIDAYDQQGPRLNAMVALNPRALADAEALDKERASGRVRGPLHGIPIVVKDNYETVDMPTTGGSIALAGFMTGRDAFQVRKLRDAGAVIIGKTNLHELARGITTISSFGGQTKNPYDLSRNPGGSSGGTGAAVAANFATVGMGSDTCGSIRIPAANNNLFGLRTTQGLSSRTGVMPLSHTQDVAGPLARTVVDLALVLGATIGADPDDEVTRTGDGHRPASFRDALRRDGLVKVRIGVVRSLFGGAPEDTEGGDIVRKALEVMKQQGAEVVDVTIGGLSEVLQGSSVINAEFKFDLLDYLARFPKAPVHSLAEILDRGEYHAALEGGFRQSEAVTSRDTDAYRASLLKRTALRDLLASAMEEQKLDALAYPVLSRKPALIGEPVRGMNTCQISPSAGWPAISIPAGFTPDGLPIGVELLGRAWTDARLLSMAYAYEQAVHPRRPPITTPLLGAPNRLTPVSFTATVGGVRAMFTFDGMSGRLTCNASAPTDAIAAVHRGGDGQTGPVIVAVLRGSERARTSEVILAAADREALQKGALYLAVRSSAGVVRTQVRTP